MVRPVVGPASLYFAGRGNGANAPHGQSARADLLGSADQLPARRRGARSANTMASNKSGHDRSADTPEPGHDSARTGRFALWAPSALSPKPMNPGQSSSPVGYCRRTRLKRSVGTAPEKLARLAGVVPVSLRRCVFTSSAACLSPFSVHARKIVKADLRHHHEPRAPQYGFPTAPLASGHKGAGSGAVENPASASQRPCRQIYAGFDRHLHRGLQSATTRKTGSGLVSCITISTGPCWQHGTQTLGCTFAKISCSC